MRIAATVLASAATATVGAAPAGEAMSWAGTAIVLAVGVVAAASTGLGVALRRRRIPREPRTRPGPAPDIELTPDVAAALERRTLRRGRLRLNDEAAGAYPDPRVNAGD
jgi:hypothetical protein